MEIWLGQGNEKLRLPVLPSGIETGISFQNTVVNINSLGSVNLIGKRELKSLPLSSFFPNKEYGFVQYKGYPKPYECVKLIESWMDNPIQVTITDTNVSMQATIEAFNYSEQDSTGDVYYTLELKEYRKPTIVMDRKLIPIKIATVIQKAVTERITKQIKTTTYTVKAGDTLSDIAKRITGSSSNCYAIANQNNIKNVNLISVGQKLVIKI